MVTSFPLHVIPHYSEKEVLLNILLQISVWSRRRNFNHYAHKTDYFHRFPKKLEVIETFSHFLHSFLYSSKAQNTPKKFYNIEI
jgi:hypothetical protein